MHFARGVDGSLVDVTQVPRGSACACVCLCCNSPLLAKQGKLKAWHFGHISGASHRACAETALHLAGKDLLRDLGEILVPRVSCAITEFDVLNREHTQTIEAAASTFRFSSCSVEHTMGTRRLDALLESPAGHRLGIEIMVTHQVDEQKAKDLMNLNAPVLELNLGEWVGKPLDREILKKVLATDAPRTIVAGAQVLLEAQASKAKVDLLERLERIASSVRHVLASSPDDAVEGRKIVDRMGLHSVPWPHWLNWSGWLQGQSINELPQKLFKTHHTVWQAACAEFVHSRPGGRKFTVREAVAGVEQTIFGMHNDGDEDAVFTGISDFLSEHLVSKGLVRYCYNDDHGWGEDWYQSEAWTPPKLASALATQTKTVTPNGSAQLALF